MPISRNGATHVLVGVKPDSIKILNDDITEEIKATLVIDKEGGTYGGYLALISSAAVGDVHK